LLGLAVVLPLLFLKDPRKAWGGMIFLLVSGLFVVAFAPAKLWQRAESIQTYEEDASAMGRIRAWSVAWNVAKDSPITGAGFRFEYSSNPARWLSYVSDEFRGFGIGSKSAHSAYFQVLGDHGFVALGLYLFLMGSAIVRLTRLRRQTRVLPDVGWIGTYAEGLRAGVLAFTISGAFLNVAYFDLYYIFLAMTAILSRELNTLVKPESVTPARSRPVAAPPPGTLHQERRT
jgi:putative inorganic carbon (hco3(-)) transporter